MYAIVKTGGKQYRVERGQRLLVERLPAEEGSSVALQPLLFRSEEAVLDKAGLERVEVTARVIAHERGEKLRVFKFKPKRGYKRRNGHRQALTRIEVTGLGLKSGSRAKPAAARAGDAKAEDAKAKSTAPGKAAPTSAKATADAKAPSTESPPKAPAGKAKASAGKAKASAGRAKAPETKAKASAGKTKASADKAKPSAKGARSGAAASKPRAPKAKPAAGGAETKPAGKPKADEEN